MSLYAVQDYSAYETKLINIRSVQAKTNTS